MDDGGEPGPSRAGVSSSAGWGTHRTIRKITLHEVSSPPARIGACPHRVAFQPIVDVQTRAVVGYEALARFADGRSPLTHLDEARDGGRLAAVEIDLIRSAVREARALPADLLVTVNASADTLESEEFEGLLPPVRPWGVELTELSDVHEREGRLRDRTDTLEVSLLLDDMGSARTESEWIVAMRPDIVKIAKEIVWAACEDRAARTQLEDFVAWARLIDARVLAEGIETAAHDELLVDAGIELAQGFRHGRPAFV